MNHFSLLRHMCLHQSSTPISSSPASTPSAWCRVAWEKTHQCTSSSAPPWCTRRRRSLSRDASSSSTTPTVSSPSLHRLPWRTPCLVPAPPLITFLSLLLIFSPAADPSCHPVLPPPGGAFDSSPLPPAPFTRRVTLALSQCVEVGRSECSIVTLCFLLQGSCRRWLRRR